MTLSQAFDEFLVDQRCRGNSSNTISYYSQVIRSVIVCLGDIDVHSLDLRDCRRYAVWLQDDACKNTVSVQSYIRGFRAFLSWLYEVEYIDTNITASFKLPKAKNTVHDILTQTEVQQLMHCCQWLCDGFTFYGLRNYCIILLMLGSGLRRSEVINLRPSDLRLDDGYVIVTGKGNKQRHVPVGAAATVRLRAYQERYGLHPTLFTLVDGEPISEVTIRQIFRKLKAQTGIDRLHPHLLRHTFATYYLQNGGNIYTLQSILGHTSLEMVKRYLHFAPSFVVQTFDRYSPVDNL